MPKLIKNSTLEENPWKLIAKEAELNEVLSDGATALIVPLSMWLSHKPVLTGSDKNIAVWLDSDETPDAIQSDLNELSVIALNFPVFTDGRSYTSATTLRQRFEYKGELRAIGDVLCDQLFAMKRCGFDAFEISDEVAIDDALAAFDDFSTSYMSTTEESSPLFRRR